MPTGRRESVDALVALGFTALEAEVYAFLLRDSPATGYRVARSLGKPTANTYKAIESLAGKGAVIVDEGRSRQCRAVPSDELLTHLERSFARRRAEAASALAELGESAGDERVYQLRSHDQVLERCRSMLRSCKRVALIDVFPEPLAELRADLEEAAGRGVLTAAKVYEPAELAGVKVTRDVRGEKTRERWPGHWLSLVTDGCEHLLAFLSTDGKNVHQAVWTRSPVVAYVYHGALASEIILATVLEGIAAGETSETLQQRVEAWRPVFGYDAPAYAELMRRFRPSARDGETRDGEET